MDKAELRERLIVRRRNMSDETRAVINRAICQRVLESRPYQNCGTLFIYCSTVEEIDTHAIIADALRQGKRVCLPKCLPGHVMQPRQITSKDDLTERFHGIREPGVHCHAIAPEKIDLCIVPALACDATGARIGYGGGYYDRFLPKTRAYRMALCASSRVLSHIPVQPHDVRCDCIVTEQEVMLIHEG